jgi:hypothetical protein
VDPQGGDGLATQLAFGADLQPWLRAYGLAQPRTNELVVIDEDNAEIGHQ